MTPQIVLTVGEMQELEQMTCLKKHLSAHDLMTRAGTSLFEYIRLNILTSQKERILVLAGTGNNGGDALVIARRLATSNYDVFIYILGDMEKLSPDTATEITMLQDLGILFSVLNDETYGVFCQAVLTCTFLIDGLFGTGFKSPLDAFSSRVITHVNNLPLHIISLDIPSGLNASHGLTNLSIKATNTLIVGHYKPGNLLGDALDVSGQMTCIDIGLCTHQFKLERFVLSDSDFNNILYPRLKNTYKYHYGHVLVLGGSTGMMGAPVLAAHAALVCGAGLVSVGYNETFYPLRIDYIPEIMSKSYQNVDELNKLIKGMKSIVFGMGLNKNINVSETLQHCLDSKIPMVIDAGGFYHLKSIINDLKQCTHIVLTPHMKELSDLLDIELEQIKKDALHYVEKLAQETGMTIVLKGPTTLISNGHLTYFISAGNPGLAKAGSGDVLSGIIGAFLANGYDSFDAAKLGVFIHGKSADYAKDDLGERSMIATDVIKRCSDVIKKITQK